MSRTPDGKTLGEIVYAKLRSDILAGARKPGQRLKPADLCHDYGVSLSVVREALSRLTDRGLVRSAPRQGFAVTSLSIEDLAELTNARLDIECLVLRYAIEQGDLKWESDVIAAHHTMARTQQIGDDGQVREEWMIAHSAFHRAIVSGCKNDRLTEFANSLRDASELYQYWSRGLGHDVDRDVPAEHRALLDAALARQTSLAVEVLQQHITRTSDALTRGLDVSPARNAIA